MNGTVTWGGLAVIVVVIAVLFIVITAKPDTSCTARESVGRDGSGYECASR